ncbi:MAG TPA: tetratricopeptide repeat protein [Hyphomicrobiaceae bacterium]|jgi:tetratricopeptide (TPR) repeat protein|nr:tetratricopeptide repeat protein [Hyphomicrobiaceae bacterium]
MPSAFPARSLARLALPIVVACLALQPADTARAQSQPNAAARAQRLDEQFARLKTVTDEQDGEAAVAEIWRLWQGSGTPELDELMAQAAMLIDLGMHPLALPLLNDIVKRAPDWAEGWNKRATALYLAGEHDLSLADIDRVLVLEPRHFGALAGMGLIRIARGEYRDALAAYRKALAVNPFLKERLELIPALEKKVGDKPI